MVAADPERTVLDITAVASESVLARVVVLLGARGARIRELRCTVEPVGVARMRAVVETAPGRGGRLAATVNRVVDVIAVEATTERAAPIRCATLSAV